MAYLEGATGFMKATDIIERLDDVRAAQGKLEAEVADMLGYLRTLEEHLTKEKKPEKWQRALVKSVKRKRLTERVVRRILAEAGMISTEIDLLLSGDVSI